jgi:uncharacterized protein with HEPN domain
MPRDWTIRIEDILESISKIHRYLEGLSFDQFSEDDRTVDAVVRNFGIIGEAVLHVPENIRLAHPELPWPQMRGLRNLVIHEYFGISLEILWNTAQKDLSPLVNPLRQLLETDLESRKRVKGK